MNYLFQPAESSQSFLQKPNEEACQLDLLERDPPSPSMLTCPLWASLSILCWTNLQAPQTIFSVAQTVFDQRLKQQQIHLDWCCKVELPPVQVPSLSDDWMVREGVTKEVDVLPCDLAGEYVAVLFLTATKELKWIGPKLKSTTQIGDQTVLNRRLTGLPAENQERGEVPALQSCCFQKGSKYKTSQ